MKSLENTKKIPEHLGVILDGNRRWAKENNLLTVQGHRKGLEKVEKLIEWCKKRKVKILTLFVFSTENWNRSKREVTYLMKLTQNAIKNNIEELHKNKIKIRIIGERDKLSKSLKEKIEQIETLTKDNEGMILNIAFSYGGRMEIVEAVKKVIKDKIPYQKINEDIISKNLWTSNLDLVIRTGKEQRLSNFLIWQAAYSELYFLEKYWPMFTEKDLDIAFQEYSRRKRRFGA